MALAKQPLSSPADALPVFTTFLKLGLTSFGGPIAHLSYFRKELVERQAWVSESHYSQLLAICQFLPGPASSQLGFALGYLRAGWLGSIAAFVGFTLPSVLMLLAFLYGLPMIDGTAGQSIIGSLKVVAFVMVADAVIGMTTTLCPDAPRRLIALLALLLLVFMNSAVIQVLVVGLGAILGLVFCQGSPQHENTSAQISYSQKMAVCMFGVFLILLIALPLAAPTSEFAQLANSFYQPGALVFGGGHVVLPLLEQSVVATGFVSPTDFLTGYGASQALPGPLFSFSAYLGALIPSSYAPWQNILICVIFMFLPGFLLVIAALPWWPQLIKIPAAGNAVAGVNAAVVGLLAAALYQPIFTQGIDSLDKLVIGLVGLYLVSIRKFSPILIVMWCLLAGSIMAYWRL